MIKLPTFASGGVLRAADLNTLAAAVAELRGIICHGRSTAQRRGRRSTRQALTRSGSCRLIYDAEGEEPPVLYAAQGAWCENDAAPTYMTSAAELHSGLLQAAQEGATVLLNPHLEPARCTVDAPLDSWCAQGDVSIELGLASRDSGEGSAEEPILLRPRRMMARVVPQTASGTGALAAAGMWYGQAQPPVWVKHDSCIRKRTLYPNSSVVLPGVRQSVYLKQMSRYRRIASNWTVDVWAWGIQARMDAHGYIMFSGVSRARGAWHSGY